MNIFSILCHYTFHGFCFLEHLIIAFIQCQFFYHDHVLLIYGCNEISGFRTIEITHAVQCCIHTLAVAFYNKYHTTYFCCNMQFLCTVINIYQKQIIKQQVLDKIIFIKTLFISSQKTGQLEGCHLSHHINVITGSLCQ